MANKSVLVLTAGQIGEMVSTDTILGNLSGNAGTATALQNARAIGGVSFNGTANITVSSATSGFTVSGGDLSVGANNIAVTGSIGSTGSRVLKGWFIDLQVTNAIAGSITGNAATVTTNANLTGVITSSGNATFFGSFTSAQILAGCSDETGAGALVFGTNPTLDAPVINNLPTGTGVSSSSAASTLVSRGSTQNSFANAFVNKATNLASAAGTTILTTSSARIYTLTGVTTQTIQLPDATNLTTGATYIFNNDSTGLLTITNDGGSTVCTIAAGGAALITCTSISTANGAYTVRFFMPSNAVFGTAGLIVTGTLAATSVNKLIITAPATSATLTVADGKTATVSNTLTFTGTDSSSVALGAGGTVAYVGTANAFTVQQNFSQATLTSTSNSIAWNVNTAQTAKHAATENTTLANPTNMVAGATYQFTWTQNASAAKTLAFGANYIFSGSSTVSATLSSVAIFTFTSDGTNMRGVMTQFAS